jgi:hypothetical protein
VPANIVLYQDGVPFAGDSLGAVLSGATGAVLTLESRNAGDSQGRAIRYRLLERASSLLPFDTTGPASAGAWLLIRKTGVGTGGLVVSAGPWTNLGGSRYISLPAMLPDEGVELEVKLAVPGGRYDSAGELYLEPSWEEFAVPLQPGHGEPGLLARYGDADATYHIAGGVLTLGAAVVDVAEVVGCVAGVPMLALAETLTADSTAADGALAVGEGYWGTVSLDSTGLVLTKGNGAVLPLDIADRVEGPGLLLGWASIAEDGTVVVYDGRERARFDLVDDGDLTPILGRGNAIAGSGLILREDIEEPVTLPATVADSRLVLLPSGLVEIVAAGASAAHPVPEPLYQFSTDADSITPPIIDLRRWSGQRIVSAHLDAADESAQAIEIPPGEWGLVGPMRAILGDVGAGTGQTIVDLQRWDGAAWVSAFVTDTTRRPTIPAGEVEAESWPETLVFRGGEIWRVRVHETLAGGSAGGISVRLPLA